MATEVEVWSVRVSGWSKEAAHTIAGLAEIVAVPDRAFDGAALLVSLPPGGRIAAVTEALIRAGGTVRAATLVGTHAARYRVAAYGSVPLP
jgi:hypothetical protein